MHSLLKSCCFFFQFLADHDIVPSSEKMNFLKRKKKNFFLSNKDFTHPSLHIGYKSGTMTREKASQHCNCCSQTSGDHHTYRNFVVKTRFKGGNALFSRARSIILFEVIQNTASIRIFFLVLSHSVHAAIAVRSARLIAKITANGWRYAEQIEKMKKGININRAKENCMLICLRVHECNVHIIEMRQPNKSKWW